MGNLKMVCGIINRESKKQDTISLHGEVIQMLRICCKVILLIISFAFIVQSSSFAMTHRRLVINEKLMPKALSTYVDGDWDYISEDVLRDKLKFKIWKKDKNNTIYVQKDKKLLTISEENRVYLNWGGIDTKLYPKIMGGKIFIPQTLLKMLQDLQITLNTQYQFLRISTVFDTVYGSVYNPTEDRIICKYKQPLDEALRQNGEYPNIDGIYSPDEPKKFAYLTFDDGPDATVTPIVLDTLKKYNIKATFFMQGVCISRYPSIVKRVSDEGYYIGNHAYSHDKSKIYTSIARFEAEVKKTNSMLYKIIGYYPKLFRPPYGQKLSPSYKSFLKDEGFRTFVWNISSGDAAYRGVPEDTIFNNVARSLQGKNSDVVILMHDGRGHIRSAKALKKIIKELWKNGFGTEQLLPESKVNAKSEVK